MSIGVGEGEHFEQPVLDAVSAKLGDCTSIRSVEVQ
jgi:hypothetical protein